VLVVSLLALLAGTSGASSTTFSPCRQVVQPSPSISASFIGWSPDGRQIVFYGRRWPPPTHPHNGLSVLQALCTMNADGTNARPVRYTVCSSDCPGAELIAWLRSGILYQRGDGEILRVEPGSKPKAIFRTDAVSIVTNPAGTRIATEKYYPGCQGCGAPVTILDARSGAVVGTAGGKKFDNVNPSLSPAGTKVAFERDAFNDPGKTFGIWTANANGRHLRRLVKVGQQPLWSPKGGTIAYVAGALGTVALRLVSAAGGRSRALVPNVGTVFGWSPDGKAIAFDAGKGELAVVYVATGKVRTLLRLTADTAAWSPDSSELVAVSTPKCAGFAAKPWLRWATWRVPVDGSKPTLISSCS
jgi:hypothetical protein